MPFFGAHLSIAGGFNNAALAARSLRADCLQIFLKSPTQWRPAAMREDDVAAFRRTSGEAALRPLLGHASYLVNLASPDDALFERSRQSVLEEWDRSERLGLDGLVIHPGAHMGSGEAAGLARIASALDWLSAERPGHRCRLTLETSAAAGTELCGRFEHFRAVLGFCDRTERIAVALDTCHLLVAGYDLRTRAGLDETLERLDAAAGLSRLIVVHANDSKGGLGSHLDRHEHIGRGKLGREAFKILVNHPALAHLPFILETPKKDERGRAMDPVSLRTLRRMVV